MTAWITLQDADLNDYLVAAQMSALRSSALARGQDNPFATVMQDRCNYIRNRISRRINISATPYAIPPELRTCACHLIIEAMAGRLAVAVKLTDDQVRMIRQAYTDLDMAGTEKFPISTPDDPVAPTGQSGGGISVKRKRINPITSEAMAGL